jgi:hypothetical protein
MDRGSMQAVMPLPCSRLCEPRRRHGPTVQRRVLHRLLKASIVMFRPIGEVQWIAYPDKGLLLYLLSQGGEYPAAMILGSIYLGPGSR